MPELAASVEVDASAEATWAALVDWPAQGAWMPLTTVQVAADSPAPADRRGGRIAAYTGLGPVGFRDPMEITGWDPPRRCEVRHLGRLIRGTGAFEVQSLPGGRSRFVWTEWLELPLGSAGAASWLLARRPAELVLRLALGRFARWVPTHSASAH